MTARRSWIVVADRRKARFFSHRAPGEGLAAAGPEEMAFEEAAEHADRPTRVHDRSGPGRHGVEAGTSADDVEREGAGRAIAQALVEGLDADAYDRVVLVAAPDMLGAIRPHLAGRVNERLAGEIASRLVDAPLRELAQRLDAEGLVGRVTG